MKPLPVVAHLPHAEVVRRGPGQPVRHAEQPEARYERRLAGGRDRDDLPDAAKPGVQGEQERGGAAVRAVRGMVGATTLADEGGDLLGREAVASPHRGSRLPAARRSTVETSGVVLGPSRGSVCRCSCPCRRLRCACLVPRSNWMSCIPGGVAPPQHPARSLAPGLKQWRGDRSATQTSPGWFMTIRRQHRPAKGGARSCREPTSFSVLAYYSA